jgi:hypothetical protein
MPNRLLSGLVLALMSITPAAAEGVAPMSVWNAQVELAQAPSVTIGPNGITIGRERDRDRVRERDRIRDRDRERFRRDRYVCVVEPPHSSDRRRSYVCDARPGRVGERCRCSGVVGSGRLNLDR